MAMRFAKLALTVLALITLAPDVHARSRFFFGFSAYGPVAPYYPAYPYYPPYYYAPPPVAYAPPPLTSQAPITLGAEVGQGCREYTAPITVGGQVVQGYGVACPRSDGSWQIVN
jgi:hypothetical protein